MTDEELRQHIRDEEHLQLLSLGYKVSAGVTAFYSLFGLLYVVIGVVAMIAASGTQGRFDGPPPVFFGLIFGGIGLVILVLGLTLAALKWRTARCLKQRRSLVFCQVIAALSCFEIPYGTLLGVLTFVVAARPSVANLFKGESIAAGGSQQAHSTKHS